MNVIEELVKDCNHDVLVRLPNQDVWECSRCHSKAEHCTRERHA